MGCWRRNLKPAKRPALRARQSLFFFRRLLAAKAAGGSSAVHEGKHKSASRIYKNLLSPALSSFLRQEEREKTSYVSVPDLTRQILVRMVSQPIVGITVS